MKSYAVNSSNTMGRFHSEASDLNGRDEFERDSNRIIHSKAFKRLQHKAQVYENRGLEMDEIRTRMSHTIEVSQVAEMVAKSLDLNAHLCRTVALGHDLGHAPFGHLGQDILQEVDCGFKFEHNMHGFMICYSYESPYLDFNGMNLMYESYEGILKHCSNADARRLASSDDIFLCMLGQRFLNKQSPSLEAQVVDYSDALAYLYADLEDALLLGIITPESLAERHKPFRDELAAMRARYPDGDAMKVAIAAVKSNLRSSIHDLVQESSANISASHIVTLDDVRAHAPLIGFSGQHDLDIKNLRRISKEMIYDSRSVLLARAEQDSMMRKLVEYSTQLFDPAQAVFAISMMTDRGIREEYSKIMEFEKKNGVNGPSLSTAGVPVLSQISTHVEQFNQSKGSAQDSGANNPDGNMAGSRKTPSR